MFPMNREPSPPILLVAESPDRGELLQAELELMGFWNRVQRVGSVPEAGRLLAERRFDLVILDCSATQDGAAAFCARCRDLHDTAVLWVGGPPEPENSDSMRCLVDGQSFEAFYNEIVRLIPAEGSILPEPGQEVPEAEARFRGVFEAVGDGIVISDQETLLILDVNAPAEALFGLSRQQLVGRSLLLLTPRTEHVAMWTLAREMAADGGALRRLTRLYLTSAGEPVTLSVCSMLKQVAGRSVFLDVLRDDSVTQRLEVELRAARETARNANRIKDEFLAAWSHVTRTPLNGILGMAQLLAGTNLSPQQSEFLESLQGSARWLAGSVEEVLDLARADMGKLTLQRVEFSLREMLRETSKSEAKDAEEKGLQLVVDVDNGVPDRLVGDAPRLRQVLVAFLRGACKITSNGELLVRASAEQSTEKTGVRICFVVEVTGQEIDQSLRSEVVESLGQTQAPLTWKFGSMGPGLAICSRLVALMGGKTWAESDPEKGARFHLEVDLPVGSDTHPPLTGAEARLLEGRAVLVIDGSAAVRHSMGEMLSRWRMLPTLVANGDQALDAIAGAGETWRSFCVIVIGAQADLEGARKVEACLKRSGASAPPVVYLTSAGIAAHPVKGRGAARVHVSKPVFENELLEAVLQVLRIRRNPEAGAARKLDVVEKASLVRHVLLAEDDPIGRRYAAHLLVSRGHTVEFAKTGREVLDQCAAQPFDIILMDVQMPEMDGLTAARLLREKERLTGRRTPIAALTANAMRGDRERCLDAGMDQYLCKPFEPQALIDLVENPAIRVIESNPDLAAEPIRERVFDREFLLNSLAGNSEFVKELTTMLLEQLPGALGGLAEAFASGDHGALRARAHKLKGSLSSLKANAASEAARRLEKLAPTTDRDRVKAAMDELVRQLEILRKELDTKC